MLRHLGPVSLFSKVRHPTSWPGSQSVTSVVLYPELLESASWISHEVLLLKGCLNRLASSTPCDKAQGSQALYVLLSQVPSIAHLKLSRFLTRLQKGEGERGRGRGI